MDMVVTAMRSASMRMAVSAHNVANVNTPNYKALRAIQTELPSQRGTIVYTARSDSGTDLVSEMVEQRMALRSMQAAGAVFGSYFDMQSTIINMWA